MECIKLTLKGRSAFFKKPDLNTYLYFTFGHVHKVALLGILGSIVGYSGYNQMRKEDIYPEFYSRLKELKIAIKPNKENGSFDKKIHTFNNSVGYASKEKGGNLIIKEQWLENPSWDIYILLDSEEAIKIKDALINRRYKYIPYLGKNDHFAEIDNISIEECIMITDAVENIESFIRKEDIKISKIKNVDFSSEFKYEEMLPIALTEETNSYTLETLVFTNSPIEIIFYKNIYKINNKNIQFI